MSGRRNWGARIAEYRRRGRRAVFLENQRLRVGIDADRGTEVFEFLFKPRDIDFTPVGPAGARDPLPYPPDPKLAFIDTYEGGWQEVFPNGGAPCSHEGVQFGQHDEVWQLPWDYEIVTDDEREVAVRFSVETRRIPFRLTKEVRLQTETPRLEVTETLENLSPATLHAMWGQHLAFGPPFLRPGCRIELPNGARTIPHPAPMGSEGRRVASQTGRWPLVAAPEGGTVDLSAVPGRGTPSDIVYLTGFEPAWYELTDPDGFGLRVEWDAAVMPYLWFWQEFGAGRAYPWYGRLYTIGLEPFSSYPTNGLVEAAANGSALLMPPGRREFHLAAEVKDD
jgi:hypothetical protein